MGQGRVVYKVFVGKPEGKRPPGRPRRRREDEIRMDRMETYGACELDSTSSGYGPVASYSYISMDMSIYIDRLI
jgi:hypothetical protein